MTPAPGSWTQRMCIMLFNISQPPTMERLSLPSRLHRLGGRVHCGNAGEEASTNTRLLSLAPLLLLQLPKLKAPTELIQPELSEL